MNIVSKQQDRDWSFVRLVIDCYPSEVKRIETMNDQYTNAKVADWDCAFDTAIDATDDK